MTDTTQAVANDAKTPAEPGAAADSARTVDPLDALLADYDQQTKTADPQPKEPATQQTHQPDPALENRLRNIEALATEAAQAKRQQDILEVVKDVRGDLDPSYFDDTLVEAWLDAQARKDPRLAQAYLQRGQNPAQFAKVKAELGRQFSKKYSKAIDQGATEDRMAVTAAVRGASTKASAEPAPKLGSMSNSEYRKHCIDNYGYDPGI